MEYAKYVIAREGLTLLGIALVVAVLFGVKSWRGNQISEYIANSEEIYLANKQQVTNERNYYEILYDLPAGTHEEWVATKYKVQFPAKTDWQIEKVVIPRDFNGYEAFAQWLEKNPTNENVVARYDAQGNRLFTGWFWNTDFNKTIEFLMLFVYPAIILIRFIIWAVKTVTKGSTHKSDSMPTIPRMKLSRVSASLLSLFGPGIAIVPAVTLIYLIGEHTLPSIIQTTIMLTAGTAFIVIRIYFARWYVNDKQRNLNWAALSLIGFWGWVVLWLLKDYKLVPNYAEPEYATCDNCSKTYHVGDYPNNTCPDCNTPLTYEM